MRGSNKRSESGQSLVLLAVLMVFFMGLLVIAVDVGNILINRRAAQNAADAGALAGARELCMGNDAGAVPAARDFACARNRADLPPATTFAPNYTNRTMTVNASITENTFFAQFFGVPNFTVDATASAGCFRPCYGESVLPVVWSCRPPVTGWHSDSTDCQQQRITWPTLQTYLATPNIIRDELYIVMDSLTYEDDFMCLEDPAFDPTKYTGIQCDFSNPPDGEADFFASGGRSWVDLDGSLGANNCPGASGEGSSELTYWITNGYGCILRPHTWISQQTGVSTSIFDAAWDRWKTGNPLVMVPVFDDMCKEGHPSSFCPGRTHSGTDTYMAVSGNQSYFHIIDYAAFYITCVRRKNSDYCPGQAKFEQLNGPSGLKVFNNGEMNSMRSIEGYFIEGVIPELDGRCTGGVDTGAYTLYLDR